MANDKSPWGQRKFESDEEYHNIKKKKPIAKHEYDGFRVKKKLFFSLSVIFCVPSSLQ